ncbi:ROK family protein [Arthrobacter sp. Hiyo4]|nr:ROK family protein [Arthrobacter sp. Hiyo4]
MKRPRRASRSAPTSGSLAAAAAGLEAPPRQAESFREHLRLGRKGLAIGIDIGGTKVAAGVVDADGRILSEAGGPPPAATRVR